MQKDFGKIANFSKTFEEIEVFAEIFKKNLYFVENSEKNSKGVGPKTLRPHTLRRGEAQFSTNEAEFINIIFGEKFEMEARHKTLWLVILERGEAQP